MDITLILELQWPYCYLAGIQFHLISFSQHLNKNAFDSNYLIEHILITIFSFSIIPKITKPRDDVAAVTIYRIQLYHDYTQQHIVIVLYNRLSLSEI